MTLSWGTKGQVHLAITLVLGFSQGQVGPPGPRLSPLPGTSWGKKALPFNLLCLPLLAKQEYLYFSFMSKGWCCLILQNSYAALKMDYTVPLIRPSICQKHKRF